MKWINKDGRMLFTLRDRQQFYDVPNPFPEDLSERITEAHKIMVELNDYLEAIYNAHKEHRPWTQVEVPAWLVEKEVQDAPPAEQATDQVSRSVLRRLHVQKGTNSNTNPETNS